MELKLQCEYGRTERKDIKTTYDKYDNIIWKTSLRTLVFLSDLSAPLCGCGVVIFRHVTPRRSKHVGCRRAMFSVHFFHNNASRSGKRRGNENKTGGKKYVYEKIMS